MALLVVGVPMAVCELLHRAFPLVSPNLSDARGVFHFKDGVWTPSPQVPGGPWGLEVSNHGAVWTIPVSGGGLSRLDGDRWTHYGSRQFGSSTDWLQGGFALRDEEVWGATGEGVVRFDGQSWQVYADALKTGEPAATVAGRSGVWIIDDEGNLSHFDGSNWTIQSLTGVLPAAPQASGDDASPRLTMTGDGRLWVSWRGLWRQDGETWREVRPSGVNMAESWPIGHDEENVWLWLWRTGEVAAVAPDGRVAARHGTPEMGLAGRVGINGLAASSGRIWIASSAGLLTFSGGQWRNQGRPPGSTTITNVALAPDGSVWVLAETRSLARIAKFVGPPLAACMIGLVLIGLVISAWLRGKAENSLAAEQALVAAAGKLPGIDVAARQADIDQQARSTRWKLCAALVGFPFVAFAVSQAVWLLQIRWPVAPRWALNAGVPAVVVLACLGIWLWVSRRRRSARGNREQAQPSRYREAIWGPAKWIVIVAIVGTWRFVPLGWVDRLIPIAAVAHLVKFALFIFVVTLVHSWRNITAVLLVQPAWRAGDYDRAMRWIRRLSLGRPNAQLIKMEGLTHGLANRPAEAEQCYRRGLAQSHAISRSDRATLLGCLAEALEDQGRHEESRKCRQAAIALGDNILGSSRHSLAEVLLRQGTEPLKALELVDEAMRIAKGPAAAKVEPSRSATRAWALAMLGRRQEAEQAIERALRIGRTRAASFATTRLKVGMALLAMDQPQKAIEHFRAALEADPKGKYGARALQQLKQHSVWGR
jgi:tetratricopeptide (TPR) repeat protein